MAFLILTLAIGTTHHITNPSVFSVDGHRYEVVVSELPPTTCSDGSERLHMWSPGSEERSLFHTFTLSCSSRLEPRERQFRATVCHPFSGHNGKMPAQWAIEKWVEHYLRLGFSHVYWYVYKPEQIVDVANVTWLVAPWLKSTPLHYGGQLTAMQHCLAINKEAGTQWTLYADVDEYLVATKEYSRTSYDIIDLIDREDVSCFDFGEYRISDFMSSLSGNNTSAMVSRITFDAKATKRGSRNGPKGHRKSLVHNKYIKGLNIHSCTPSKFCIHHFRLDEFSLLHVRNLIPYTAIHG